MPKDKKPKQKWKRWQKIMLVIAILVFLAGLGFLLFPTVSNFFGQQHANAVIDDFNASLSHIVPADADGETQPDPVIAGIKSKSYSEALAAGEIDAEGYVIDDDGNRVSGEPIVFEYDLDALYRDSLAYNEWLLTHQGTVDTTDYASAALDMSSYGLSNFYCWLSAPSIDLYLPVYLGASDAMMSSGAAHLSGTSLPVDQNDTNVAIAGHTAYIGRIFFDNIRKLEQGDTVTVHNYWESIDYKVIGKKVVAEDDTGDICIQKGRQLLTLITCIWSGHGDEFDRYIVICERKK